MTTAVHFFLPVSDSISNHLSLSSALDEPSQRVMQPYSPVSPSDSTLTVLNPPSSHFTPGERYQDTPLRPIPSFSSSLPSLPRRTLPPPSKLNHHQHFVSQTHRPISPIGTPQTPLAGLGRYETHLGPILCPLTSLELHTDIQEPLQISVKPRPSRYTPSTAIKARDPMHPRLLVEPTPTLSPWINQR